MEKPKVVIISGTGPGKLLALIYYWLLARNCKSSHIIPIPGRGWNRLDDSYPKLERKIERLVGDGPTVIICHSQGGYHGLEYARKHQNVYRVVCLSWPGHGSHLARFWSPVASFRFMARGSRYNEQNVGWLHNWLESQTQTEVFSVFTPFDLLIWPWTSSYLTGAKNVVLVPRVFHFLVPDWMKQSSELIDVFVNHITETLDPKVVELIGQLALSPPATMISMRAERDAGGRAQELSAIIASDLP